MKEIKILKNDANQRLDKFLTKYFKSRMPQSLLHKFIRKKRIKINDKAAKLDAKLFEGDILKLYINDEFFEESEVKLDLVKPNFSIIYEDENIILIDKKVGVVVHSDDGGTVNTLIAQLHSYLFNKGEYNPKLENSFVPALCNRIDRNTMGIVVAAKNAEALRVMNDIIKHRMVKKFYIAEVEGIIKKKEDTMKAYLTKNEKEKRVFVSDKKMPNSKEIITKYKVLKYKENSTLVEVELITGRTHQIRAHFSYVGHPLIGDGKYAKIANQKQKAHNTMKHQALHAYKLIFTEGFENTILEYLTNKTFTSNQKLN